MSVLIEGMEMLKPELANMTTVYHAYVLVEPNGHAVIEVDNDDGTELHEYPLIVVPSHGRLIDADALCASHKEVCSRSMKFNLDLAPTIIPASKEDE